MKCTHCIREAVDEFYDMPLCKFHMDEATEIANVAAEEERQRWIEDEQELFQEEPMVFNALLKNIERRLS